MLRYIPCYFLGVMFSFFFAYLPSYFSVFSYVVMTFLVAFLVSFIKPTYTKQIIAFGCGLGWVLTYSNFICSKQLPDELEGKTIWITGCVASIATLNQYGMSFLFKIHSLADKKTTFLIRLNWPDCSGVVHPGEKWRLSVKLKQIHSLSNPGTFDTEKIALYQHIRAQGVVKKSSENRLLKKTKHYLLTQWREELQKKIVTILKDNPYQGIFLALIIGETSKINSKQWETFRNTGTSHLLAISGLHIGLFVRLVEKLVMLIWKRFAFLPIWIATPKIAGIGAICAAFFYGGLAGFSVSTQRALIMITVFLTTQRLLHRNVSILSAFLLALAVMTFFNPLVILSMGFWLSFLAVGSLLYGCSFRVNVNNFAWRFFKPQWSVSIGMLPITLFFFRQYPLLGLPANMLAIPMMSFLIIPLCLMAAIFSLIHQKFAAILFSFDYFFLNLTFIFLKFLAMRCEFLVHQHLANGWILFASLVSVFILLMPRGIPTRWLAVLWFLPVLFGVRDAVDERAIKLIILDVGQGLAVLVRTKMHTLLYDTGAKANDNFDMGKAVVLPYLISANIKKIDLLMISHDDNDHIGGAASVLKEVSVNKILTSVPERFSNTVIPASFCNRGIHWRWDGVEFEVIHPTNNLQQGNNSSCVLKIASGEQRVLLTGDIEKEAERNLTQSATKLQSKILLVPHHGSKTSSTKDFIEKVNPVYSVVSCGYHNRYHHPHPNVLARYREISTSFLNTVTSGAIIMTLNPGSDIVVTEYRKKCHRFWQRF